MVGEIRGDEDGVEVLGEEVVLVVRDVCAGNVAREGVAHRLVDVAPGDDVDVERAG